MLQKLLQVNSTPAPGNILVCPQKDLKILILKSNIYWKLIMLPNVHNFPTQQIQDSPMPAPLCLCIHPYSHTFLIACEKKKL